MAAYLDAGAASMIVGAIAAGFAGVGVFVKMQVNKMRDRLSRKDGPTADREG